MLYVALQDFEHFGAPYRAGEALPKRARNWLDLRKLQRRGLVSWEEREVAPPGSAAPALQAPPGAPPAEEVDDQGEPEAIASSEPEGAAKPKKKKSKKRAQ